METPSILIGLIFGEKYDLELIRGPESTHADVKTKHYYIKDDKLI